MKNEQNLSSATLTKTVSILYQISFTWLRNFLLSYIKLLSKLKAEWTCLRLTKAINKQGLVVIVLKITQENSSCFAKVPIGTHRGLLLTYKTWSAKMTFLKSYDIIQDYVGPFFKAMFYEILHFQFQNLEHAVGVNSNGSVDSLKENMKKSEFSLYTFTCLNHR